MQRPNLRIGIMLAPGAKDDDSVNSHVTAVASTIRQRAAVDGTRPNIDIVHPELSAASIENAGMELLNHRCTHIFVVGEQCRPTLEQMRLHIADLSKLKIYFLNDGRVEPKSNRYCDAIDLGSENSVCGASNLFAHNFYEPDLTEALGHVVANFSRKLSQTKGFELKPVLIAAAPVPAVRRWQIGFDRYIEKSSVPFQLEVFHLGTGYGRFNDPWSAFELTQYLVSNYGMNLILEVTGASSRGIVAALREMPTPQPIYYCPFDQKPRDDFRLPTAQVPFCVERNIEDYFLSALKEDIREPQSCGSIYCRNIDDLSIADYAADIDLSASSAKVVLWE